MFGVLIYSPSFPKKPHIKVINNFKKSKKDISLEIYKKIIKLMEN